jgi:hypothetical protein
VLFVLPRSDVAFYVRVGALFERNCSLSFGPRFRAPGFAEINRVDAVSALISADGRLFTRLLNLYGVD